MLPYDHAHVAPLCAELDAWRERLDRRGTLSRRWLGRLRRDLEAEAVAASVGMEQVPVTLDEVRRILVGERPSTVTDADRELVHGYRGAMEFVLRRADDPNFQWNRELVVGIHDRVLAGSYAAGAGRLATGARWVVNSLTGEEVFEPPAAAHVPALIDEACLTIQRGLEHPAIEAAWIHVALAAVHPFQDGNGRVCRVVASLAMYRGGFRRQEFTSLEEWWGRHLTDYYGVFSCLGRTFDREADVTPFIVAHARAQLSQVRALELRERVEHRIWEALETVVEDAHLRPRLVNALWDAFFERSVTPAYYIPVTDVSRATATNDLAAAVAAGLLEPLGGGRARRYVAAPALYERVGAILGIDVPAQNQRVRIVSALSRDLGEPDELP
jgi:Fic family protein